NHASADGGGIHTSGSATDIIISGSTIFDNTAQRGAGIYHGTGSLEVHSATTVSENTSVAHGAGIYNAATMSVNDTTISGNISTTGSGAGVYQSTQSTSRSSITRTAIIDNRASINSGAIYLSSGAL